MMRKWMFAAVNSTPGRVALIGDRLMTTGAVDGPAGDGDRPDTPFAVLRAATNQGGMGHVKQQRYQVWLHRDPGSMIDIDDFMKALEEHVPTLAPSQTAEGVVMDAKWEDTSGDGFDDHFQTVTRYASFLLTYNPA